MAMYDLEMMDLGLEPEDFALEERHEEEPEGPEDIGDWIVRVTSSWPYTNVPAPHVHCVVGGEEASDRCALAAEEEHDRAALPRALVSDWEASRRCAVWAEEQEELVSLLRAQPVPLKARMIHRRLMRVRMVPGSGAPSPVKWPQPQGPEGGILDDLLHILWDGHARPDDIFAYLMRHSLPRLRAFWTGLACEPTPAPAAPARHATLLAADSPLRDVHQSIVLFLDWQSLARVRRAARSLDHAVRRVAQGRLVAGRCALEVLQETPFASRVLRALDVPGAERPTASCAPDEADPGAAPLRAPPVVWERPVSSGAAPACLGAAAGRPAFWHHVMAPAAPAAEADALPLPDLFERYCTHYVHACPADARRWWPLVAECVGRGAWGPRATHAWCETALAGAPALVVLRYSAPQPLHVTEARLRDLLGAGDRDLPCDFEARAHIRYVPDAFHGLAAGPGRAPGADWRAWGWEYVWEVVRAALGAAAGPEAQEKILMALWTRFRGADHCVWRRVWYDAETLGLVESVSAPVGTVLGRVLARVAALRPC